MTRKLIQCYFCDFLLSNFTNDFQQKKKLANWTLFSSPIPGAGKNPRASDPGWQYHEDSRTNILVSPDWTIHAHILPYRCLRPDRIYNSSQNTTICDSGTCTDSQCCEPRMCGNHHQDHIGFNIQFETCQKGSLFLHSRLCASAEWPEHPDSSFGYLATTQETLDFYGALSIHRDLETASEVRGNCSAIFCCSNWYLNFNDKKNTFIYVIFVIIKKPFFFFK